MEMPRIANNWGAVAELKDACAKCKTCLEAEELLRCSLCNRHTCKRCAVKRYGRKFCSDRCMICYGLDDEL